MPHVLEVNCCLVLRFALLLEVQRSEQVHRLVYSSLEQDVTGLEELKRILDFLHRVESNSHRTRDMAVVIEEGILFHDFLSVVLG
jgi:hypothetical protein